MRDNENAPVIRIETRHFHITFETDTMELLGKPRHMEFLWDNEENILSAVIVEKHTRFSTRLPTPRKKDALHPTKVHEPCIVKELVEKLGWESGRCYEITGTYDPDKKTADFPLAQAEDAGGWENAL